MLVENWMATNVIAVKPDTSLLKCRNLLKEHQIRRLPVVDDQNRVVGIISDRDVKGASPSKATALEVHEMQYLLAELKAKDIMTAKPVTIKPWDSVEQAAIIMMDKKFGGLPVVSEDNKLVGIITDQDIFKLLINITGARVEGMQFAFELPRYPRQHARDLRYHAQAQCPHHFGAVLLYGRQQAPDLRPYPQHGRIGCRSPRQGSGSDRHAAAGCSL